MISQTLPPPILRKENKAQFSAINNKERGRLLSYLYNLKQVKTKDLASKVILYRAVSLCISLALVIVLFEWKSYNDENLVAFSGLETEFEEMMEIPITKQPPPPPPQTQMATITEVPDIVEIENEIEVDLDVEISEESVIEEIVYDEFAVEEEVADEIFQFVEQAPTPVGGMAAFYDYIGSNMVYPQKARRSTIEGKVYVQFVVGKDGSITDI